ncbi:hypothetical protein SAMN05660668_02708 [Pseudobutyrivibrio sp. AR14]|uniref:hypothetical protein n=1 Tax=Pseudobutyrivibrio sp. AR14 TaxID=1520804 RepID=UPI0008905614|nr:hypothetical protein [Pseudobutyrivibrio sp. AR14]SCY45787.1 hypothetical protein SAMN05660668_02708 [Pseudobutyrivibrio sp. AR14]
MARLLSTEELQNELSFEYSRGIVLAESKRLRKYNVESFNLLSRDKLEYNKRERRLLLYTTLHNENIYIQYPGKESDAERKQVMPFDFRPELQKANGEFIPDISFGDIWDILDKIGSEAKKYLPFVASLFLHMSYMHNYENEKSLYEYADLDMKNGTEIEKGNVEHEWYRLNISEDIWFTLNDRIGPIELDKNNVFSFEAFIKLVDLLFQNEDCKYYYKNVVIDGKSKYNFENGRTQSSDTNLLIISHLEEKTKLSSLLNSFQKSRGVPGFKKQDYSIVTNDMVINIDFN